MNFFERQAAARRASTRLVVLFALAVLAIVLLVDALAWVLSGGSIGTVVMATVATVAMIGIGSAYRLASLRAGGDAIATQLGGVRADADTTDPALQRLRNVVDEVAIASGVPVPRLYVLEEEPGINAFAAGHSPSDAVVAVTRGALERLNRDELQGVVAHEFAHILNGDMRLNLRLVGVLYGISMLGLVGRRIFDFSAPDLRRHGRRGFAGLLMLGVLMLVLGWIGLFFARLIRAAISRHRERLADAGAVQFTRQTAGLSGALKKIGGLADGSWLGSAGDAEEVSHMLFGEGIAFSGRLQDWFATHPPLPERIAALEPGFRPARLDALARQWRDDPPMGLEEDLHLGLHAPGALPMAAAGHAVSGAMMASHAGSPDEGDRHSAGAIIASIPAGLRALASDRGQAGALVLALLIDGDAEIAERQLFGIGARLGRAVSDRVRGLANGELAGLHPMLRMPLAALAFPVLRRRPRPQLELLLDAVEATVHADGEVSLFEYCLGRLLVMQLRESLDPGRHPVFGRRKPVALKAEIAALLAVVAQAGHGDVASARHAYLAGLQRILPREHLDYQPVREPVTVLDGLWASLDALDPLAKQLLVEAVTVAISHDGRIGVAEAELLRTICGVLHCPLPPMPGVGE